MGFWGEINHNLMCRHGCGGWRRHGIFMLQEILDSCSNINDLLGESQVWLKTCWSTFASSSSVYANPIPPKCMHHFQDTNITLANDLLGESQIFIGDILRNKCRKLLFGKKIKRISQVY